MQEDALIIIEHLTKKFPIGGREFTALDDVSLTFRKGEFTGLVGPSGSGKTTLLNIMGALDDPTQGMAVVMGKDTRRLSHARAAQLRNEHLGFIFQTYNLLPVYTVYENVEFPLLLLGVKPPERRKAVMQALEWVGLADRSKSRPSQLSGGESQRVAVARAMVKMPRIVLADEPTANLDAANSHNILKMMARLNRELASTFIFATHDEKVIRYLRRLISLADGMIVADQEKTPEEH
ncbi:ABC transporter ATP-binding protein [Thermodesulfobacteriota bacterium]